MRKKILKKLEETCGSPRQAGTELVFPRCPFCGDEKGHFYVESNKLLYHCFKCNAGGGVYSLAKQLGVRIHDDPAIGNTQRIKETAAQIFRQHILSDSADAIAAREWLKSRGIPEKLLHGFTVGEGKIKRYLPIGLHPGDAKLLQDLRAEGFEDKAISSAGVLLKSKLRRWAGGLVFFYYLSPTNIGRFKARKVGQPASTAVWLPGKEIGAFGLNLGDWKGKEAIVVEGEFDALALQVYSILHRGVTTTAVALSGGGGGPAAQTLIRNGIDTLIIMPDNDAGGMNFVANVSRSARSTNGKVYVVPLPAGEWKDPADWVDSGAPSMETIYDHRETIGEFLATALQKYRIPKTDKPEGLEEARQIITKEVRRWQLDSIDRQHVAQKLAPALSVDPKILDDELRRISADMLGWDIEIKDVKQEIGDTVRTIFKTSLGEITLPTQQLISPLAFQKRALELRKVLPTPKKSEWESWIQQVLTEAEITDAPADITTKYQVEDILVRLLRTADPGKTKHIEAMPVLSEDESEYWITWPVIKHELKSRGNERINDRQVAAALSALGGTSKRIRLASGSRHRVWAFQAQEWDARYYKYDTEHVSPNKQKDKDEEFEIPF